MKEFELPVGYEENIPFIDLESLEVFFDQVLIRDGSISGEEDPPTQEQVDRWKKMTTKAIVEENGWSWVDVKRLFLINSNDSKGTTNGAITFIKQMIINGWTPSDGTPEVEHWVNEDGITVIKAWKFDIAGNYARNDLGMIPDTGQTFIWYKSYYSEEQNERVPLRYKYFSVQNKPFAHEADFRKAQEYKIPYKGDFWSFNEHYGTYENYLSEIKVETPSTKPEDASIDDDKGWYENTKTGKFKYWDGKDQINWNRDYLKYIGKTLTDDYITSKGGDLKHINEIRNDQYLYTKHYGWIDYGHLGGKANSDPTVSAKNLWKYISTEKSNIGISNKDTYRVKYTQSQGFKFFSLDFSLSFDIDRGLTGLQKAAVALAIMLRVSTKFERAQAIASDSGFSPEDIPSNVLGLYMVMFGWSMDTVNLFTQPLSKEKSIEMLMNNPTTFTSSKYKNRTMKPVLFSPYDDYTVYNKVSSLVTPSDAEGHFEWWYPKLDGNYDWFHNK